MEDVDDDEFEQLLGKSEGGNATSLGSQLKLYCDPGIRFYVAR